MHACVLAHAGQHQEHRLLEQVEDRVHHRWWVPTTRIETISQQAATVVRMNLACLLPAATASLHDSFRTKSLEAVHFAPLHWLVQQQLGVLVLQALQCTLCLCCGCHCPGE